MTIEQNKTIVSRFIEAINAQDFDELDAVAVPSLTQYARENMIPWLYATFPGHKMIITDMIAEGDKVVARLETSGGHGATWEGIPPSGKQFTNTGVYFLRLEKGKIADMSSLFDDLNLVRQLGGTITPSEA